MISPYGVFVTTNTEIKQPGHGRSRGRTPASEPDEIADAARHTGHRGTGVALSGHNRRCTSAGSRRSPSGGYPVLAKLGRLSRYVDPVQASHVFTQDLLLDLQGQIHVVLL